MRFRYPFQKVVDLKNNEKTQAEWVLSKAIGKLQIEESSLNDLYAEKNSVQDIISNASSLATKISDLLVLQEYLSHIEVQITSKQKDVQHAHQNVSIKQKDLSTKVLDEKVWDLAKDKAFIHFKTLSLKKDQDQLDEMATMRFIKA